MKPATVAKLLNPREFIALCSKIDKSTGGATKFDVINVLREGKKVTVTVQVSSEKIMTVEMGDV